MAKPPTPMGVKCQCPECKPKPKKWTPKKVYIVYRLNDDGIEAHISFVTASKKKAEAAAKGQNG